jgi:hypothetical protein
VRKRQASPPTKAPAMLMLDGEATLSVRLASAALAAGCRLQQIDDGSATGLPNAPNWLAQRARTTGHGVARLRARAGQCPKATRYR